MKNYKYIGNFKSFEGHQYSLEVYCNGFIQAFFLLTAKAIEQGKHYQLSTITSEEGDIRYIDDILKVEKLINSKIEIKKL